MNKLIIAGNGFDLAHGLPTSYNHFMDAFWRDLHKNSNYDFIQELIFLDEFEKDKFLDSFIMCFDDFIKNVHDFIKKYNKDPLNYGFTINIDRLFSFKNQLFKTLNEVKSIQNWVDVENEYYKALKNICKDETLSSRSKKQKVIKLHQEFEKIKQLLEIYLQKHVVEAYDFKFENDERIKVSEVFKPIIYGISSIVRKGFIDEFAEREDKELILQLNRKSSEAKQNGKSPKLNLTHILSFNYTSTLQHYLSSLYDNYPTVSINYIHGVLNQNINFGFGDEMDDDYSLIENMDDNEYLRYFKSFQYLQNSNYKRLLNFVDSDKFQVIIMGHSCGLSDRTLLNTIFEHENCRSIKVYYYKNGDYDNYTEIIQNISRHFNDKKLMRTKIVEKTLCEPMPQIQLPRKK